MESHNIKFPRTAHYSTQGTISPTIKQLWLVFHGYGQLAKHIIRKFDELDETNFVIAPEGLSRFYWNESKGIVGASWMTKEDRLSEIEDYCNYIEYLYHFYKSRLPQDVNINILGFSQGGATAVRWMERHRPAFNNLILWGAAFPTDLQYIPMKDYLMHKKLFCVFGRQDEYLSDERVQLHSMFTNQQELNVELVWFDGKHEIDRVVLNELAERIC